MSYKNIKKIDIHAHATPNKQVIVPNWWSRQPMIQVDELVSFHDRVGVEKAVILPLVSPEFHFFQLTNQEAKQMADERPDRFVWFCNIDPRGYGHSPEADLSYVLNFYKDLGARGVGELTANLLIDDPLMDNFFYHCGECDMPVTIHIAPVCTQYGYYGIRDDVGLPRLERALKKFPKLKIFGHSQLFWAEIAADVTEENRTGYPTGKVTEGRLAQLLREYPNLYCDVSAHSGMNALKRDPEYAARFIEEFSDRLMFGIDICAPTNTHHLEFDAFLDRMCEEHYISDENYYKFVRGNAERLLHLT